VFRIEQVLAQGAAAEGECTTPPPELTPSPEQVLVPMVGGGPIVVDGIRVTQGNWSPLVPESGRRYLLIGRSCPERRTLSAGWPYGMWPLSDSGGLEPQDNRQWEVFRAFPRLASVATIRAYLEERKTQRIERE
jgi:hypothetical protein